MNAIPPRPLDPAAAARTARHLRQLEELAELGMALARAVAHAALQPPAAEEPPTTKPGTRPTGAPAPVFPGDPGLAFSRLAHSVRQTIALEARIVAGRDAPSRPPPPPPDRRRALLRDALHEASGSGTDRGTDRAAATAFRREVDERIEDELAADPDGHYPVDVILVAIADDLGITLDWSRLSDEVIGMTGIKPDPAQPLPPLPGTRATDTSDPPDGQPARPHGPDPP